MKSPSAVPRFTLFGLSGDNTVHLHIMSVAWHSIFREHSEFTLQLHGFNWHRCFFVVRFYNARHVSRAIITNIYSDCVENCIKFIRFSKVLIFQIQKSFSYVGGENFVKRWIEPNDDTAGISFLFYVLLICIN